MTDLNSFNEPLWMFWLAVITLEVVLVVMLWFLIMRVNALQAHLNNQRAALQKRLKHLHHQASILAHQLALLKAQLNRHWRHLPMHLSRLCLRSGGVQRLLSWVFCYLMGRFNASVSKQSH